MEKNQKRATYIILNSNVLFSSLIKGEGFTRAVLLLLMRSEEFKFVIPKTVVNEFKLHAGEIARKARLPIAYIINSFEKLIEGVERIDETSLKEQIIEGLKYVNEEKDSPFVAVALKFKPSYILTYNKKDYKIKKLKKREISVISPKEALELMGIEKLEVETKEKFRKSLTFYLGKLKIFRKFNFQISSLFFKSSLIKSLR